MNEAIMKALGFEKEVEMVKQRKCPFCGELMTQEVVEAMPRANYNEYQISGLCSACQKEVFG